GLAHGLREAVVDDGTPGRLGETPDHAVLQLNVLPAAGLDRAGAHFAQHVAERENLLFIGPQSRDVATLRVIVALFARHREAERASFHAVAHDILHGLDLVIGGTRLLALFAHHVMPHGGMADQIADIDAETLVEMVHVLASRLPIEVHRAKYVHRDRFDVREEFGEPLLGAFAHRRQRQGAIAEDHGGGAMLWREGAERVPGDLGVVMAVVVDKAGGDGTALGVDRAACRSAQFADFDDLAVLDADIASKSRHPRAVDNQPVLDQQIVRHRYSPRDEWFRPRV